MFKKATREKAFLRLALMGPAGSGKTYSALLLAKHLGAKKIALIDSERGSARLYASLVDFDVCELENFAVERYMDAIAFAQREGYDCLIIDSLSHAWAGKDGILEFKDKRTEQSRSKDSFGAGWRDASPLHNKFIDSILAFRGHVIATLRTKTEYVIEDGPNGRKTPRKIGMAPVQRDGVEYEFTVVGDFVDHNKLAITKTRIDALNDAVLYKPGREMAETILAWLAEGVTAPPQAPPVAPPAPGRPAEPPQAPAPDPKRAEAEAALARCLATYPGARAEIETAYHEATTADDALLRLRRIWTRLAAVKPQLPQRDTSQAALATRITQIVALLEHDGHAAAAKAARETISEYGAELGVAGIANADLPGCLSEVEAIANTALAPEVAA